jgi:hypothetical protein
MSLIQIIAVAAAIAAPTSPAKTREVTGVQAATMSILDDARTQFRNKNMDEVSTDILSVAALVRVEASQYSSEEKIKFDSLLNELSLLSKTLKTLNENQNDFDRLIAALALRKALVHKEFFRSTSLDPKKLKKTGVELMSAVHAFEHGILWASGQIPDESKKVIDQAEEISKRLKENLKVDEKEIKTITALLDSETNKLDVMLKIGNKTH